MVWSIQKALHVSLHQQCIRGVGAHGCYVNTAMLTRVMVEVSGHEGNVTVLTGVMVKVSGHEGNVTVSALTNWFAVVHTLHHRQ